MEEQILKIIFDNSVSTVSNKQTVIYIEEKPLNQILRDLVKLFAIPDVSKQSELFISFARYVENATHEKSYSELFEDWKKRNK
jgi:hypothetical protein